MTELVYTTTTKFTVITCFKCTTPFCIPTEMHVERLRSQDNFWCPNGHSQAYIGKTKEQKLQEELDRVTAAKNTAIAERNDLEAQLIDTGRKLERTKKRLKGGKCPCCNRNFTALARHLAAKHPEYGDSHKKAK